MTVEGEPVGEGSGAWPTQVRLMRHGGPNWQLVTPPPWRGGAHDLVPLTRSGEEQAVAAADALHEEPPDLILSSPMTRALQTAALVATRLGVPLSVHIDLREWLPDQTYQWTTAQEVDDAYADMLSHVGRPRPVGATWEPLEDVRHRAMSVLTHYLTGEKRVLVVCHEVLIHALTGEQRTPFAGTRALVADEPQTIQR